ncbi:heat-labile enterotoxin alpha chain domain-containing protein [Hirsutella rhossiliensis]
MVAVNPSLGSYSPFQYQKEHAVVGFIPQDQIVGWYRITDETHSFTPKGLQEAADKIKNNDLEFAQNPTYDEKKYAKKRGGARPELAGFPKDHKAWAEKPWKAFKDKPVRDIFEQMLQRICGKVKAKRDLSCLTSFGSQVQTYSTLAD